MVNTPFSKWRCRHNTTGKLLSHRLFQRLLIFVISFEVPVRIWIAQMSAGKKGLKRSPGYISSCNYFISLNYTDE
jgi:hypothetical protein